MNECLWCDYNYDPVEHNTCPNCAVNTDTKGITVIVLKEDKE
jgi:hypothetical protein